MPYKNPQKQRAAVRRSMQKKRQDPAYREREREQQRERYANLSPAEKQKRLRQMAERKKKISRDIKGGNT